MLDDRDEACLHQAEEEADQRKEELRKWQRARMGRLFVLVCVTFVAGLATTYVLWDSFAPIIALPLGVCISGILAFGAAMVDAGNDPMWQGSLELTLKRAADDRKRGWLLILGGLVGVLVLVAVRIFVYAGPLVALLLGSVAVLMVDLAPIGAALWYAQVERVCRDLLEKYNHAEQFARQLQKHPEQSAERLWPDAVLAADDDLQPLNAQLNKAAKNLQRDVRAASALTVHVLSKRVAFFKWWLNDFLRQRHPYLSFMALEPKRLRESQVQQLEAKTSPNGQP